MEPLSEEVGVKYLHRNREYLRLIIELAYEMNPSGKRRYRKEELLRVLG